MSTATLRDRQKRQTRLHIVESAVPLFLEHGFDEVSVETICSRAGISRATFFNHFPQKDLIISEIVLSRVERMREMAAGSLDKAGATTQDLIDLFVTFARENERLGDPGRALMSMIFSHPLTRAHLADMRRELLVSLTAIVRRLQKRGSIRSASPARLIAETLFGIYLSASLEWLIDPPRRGGAHVQAVRQRLQLFVAGIA